MAESSKPVSGLQRAYFEKTCTYCGALFHVELARQSGSNSERMFACPECGKHYEVLSALPPKVRLINARNDGKSGGYQETMF
jgi:predicted RNA-binding Zn-ribbon protein involved in translation (DUF1610 family)